MKPQSNSKSDKNANIISPELLPGTGSTANISNYADIHASISSSEKPWLFKLNDKNDIDTMQELAKLTPQELIAEVKFLNRFAYKLGLEEAKEMTRGKYLNVFGNKERENK